ncbi:MAG: sugar ABC transporter permease [Clostridiales bacterium]|jgi:raffinose/stachyose/melibiose transport system permease protein|nr:sugar ABC transporter permease [Clostridiales bacterium]
MKKKMNLNHRSISRYVFLLPGFCFFSFAVLIPFLMGVNIAFTDWNGITKDYTYVFLDNFISIFKDTRVSAPIANSIKYAVLGTVGGNVLSLSLAMLINHKTGKLSKMARVIFFTPVCISAILTSFLWGFIYREVFPQLFGIKSLLGNRTWAIPAITAMGLWNGSGINMLIYFSGLKNIPTDLYEAAVVDGANVWQKFRKITLPLLTPSFTVCITLTLTAWFREFAMTLSATGGGPAGASRTISIYIFENLYEYYKAGYGQAVALLFALFLVVVGCSVSRFFRKREVEL